LFATAAVPRADRAKAAKTSLLDAVMHEVTRLNSTLPGTDRTRLNEYLEDIREIERRTQQCGEVHGWRPPTRRFLRHAGIVRRTYQVDVDMQALAFQADVTPFRR